MADQKTTNPAEASGYGDITKHRPGRAEAGLRGVPGGSSPRGGTVWGGGLSAVEAQSPAHLVLVHDGVGVAARDAGFVG